MQRNITIEDLDLWEGSNEIRHILHIVKKYFYVTTSAFACVDIM